MPKADFYYRRVGESNWIRLPRLDGNIKELNTVGQNQNINSPAFDAPEILGNYYKSGFVYTDVPRAITDTGSNGVWVQTVRAFDFSDFPVVSTGLEANAGIEYCIVMQDQVIQPLLNLNPNIGFVRSWITVDDINYPSCVPWQGVNSVVANNGTPGVTYPLFKYFRSTESGDSLSFRDANTLEVWAKSPYGDYVEQLYTDAAGITAYVPASQEEPYTNLRLDRAVLTGINSWTTFTTSPDPTLYPIPDAVPQNLQFSVGFGLLGSKIITSSTYQNVSAVRVFDDQTSNQTKGTLRIKKKT